MIDKIQVQMDKKNTRKNIFHLIFGYNFLYKFLFCIHIYSSCFNFFLSFFFQSSNRMDFSVFILNLGFRSIDIVCFDFVIILLFLLTVLLFGHYCVSGHLANHKRKYSFLFFMCVSCKDQKKKKDSGHQK